MNDELDQWMVDCPKCGEHGRLIVFEVSLLVTGKKHYPNSVLESDGFIVDSDDELNRLKDQSTFDEKVRCEKCDAIFELINLEH